nr:hypothetical protein [Tanacetum cinerariifolium]
MSTHSSARNLFPPLDNPELTIRRRSRADPTLLNSFEMAVEGNSDLPVPDLQTMKELCQPSLNVQNSFQFHGLPGDNANKHLDKFLHVTQSIKVNGVTDHAILLYLFPRSLTHHATAWFDRFPRNSINTFEQMAKMFLRKYFSPSMVTKLGNEITNFRQRPDGSLFEAWRPEECYDLIENITAHHNDWDTLAKRIIAARHFITAVSYELMLSGLMKVAAVNLMLLGHKLMLSRVVVLEAIIRRDLHLDDADGLNAKIFKELARIGYEKPPLKLTFYKAFFFAQWKFLIHTLVQCLSAKRNAWNEFSYSMASAVICLATCRKLNFSKYIFDSMVRNVDSPSEFLMYPRFLQVVLDHQGRLNQEDVDAGSKGVSAPKLVSAAEPTVFDDEDVTMTMAQTLIKLKAEKAIILDE